VKANVSAANVKRSGRRQFAVNQLIDAKVDLSVFAARYKNDRRGPPAYDPALLLKVILYAYSKALTSIQGIESLCREDTRSLFW
jgi:transposase